MAHTMAGSLRDNFLGNSPVWYKNTIIAFLILNPILVTFDPFIAGPQCAAGWDAGPRPSTAQLAGLVSAAERDS